MRHSRTEHGAQAYILDIENMQGDCDMHITEGEVAHSGRGHRHGPDVGTSCPRSLIADSVWKGARQVFHGGYDGADLALLDVLDGENIAARFSSVALDSGTISSLRPRKGSGPWDVAHCFWTLAPRLAAGSGACPMESSA